MANRALPNRALPHRVLKWTGGTLLAVAALLALFLLLFNWNWLRGPIERWALDRTGRELKLNGDLSVKLRWPIPRLRAEYVTFANPAWAREKQMLAADAVEIELNLPQILRKDIHLREVRLDKGVVFLEQSPDGRKNWLLDLEQRDEQMRVSIGVLALAHGRLGYDEPAQRTSVRAEISTTGADDGVVFEAHGTYKGLALKGSGSGGPVLGLRDEVTPYPMRVEATVGATSVKADGTITSLLRFTEMDMSVALRGPSLADLFPFIGIALPKTRAYVTEGRLVHSGQTWRYEKFSGRIGDSDVAGNLRVDVGGERPVLQADVHSRLLAFEDLGPLIGARPGSAVKAAATGGRVLPDVPFNTELWDTLDADVKLTAKSIRRAEALPIENLSTRLKLRDSVLTLDPLEFGFAGGKLATTATLDGRKNPIRARVKVRASRLELNKLFPTVDLTHASVGRVEGEIDLAGTGNSVGKMLATAEGKVGLAVAGGEISNTMMEIVGLDVWEYFKFKAAGDRPTQIRCGVADFGVHGGVMQVGALVLDTVDTNVSGSGTVNLRDESLALRLDPQPKDRSPVVLRGPIRIAGTLAKPDVQLSKGRIAARGLGALVLGLINPLLAVIPLIETGPGKDSDCARLIEAAMRPGVKSPGVKATAWQPR